jgi:outer membrane protein OmpA-like peptidoglycan-associated protein
MRLITGILAVGVIAGVSSVAHAEDGWYFGAQTGLNIAPDATTKGTGLNYKAEHELGYGLIGQGGYAFGPVRVEGELGWRINGVDKVNNTGASGDIESWSAMGNLYYDFATGTRFTPYVGAGVGGAIVNAAKVKQAGATLFDDNDAVLAYQGIVGASYLLNDNLSVKADYRYLAAEDPGYKSPANVSLDSEYSVHAVMVGFTWRFGAPKPAPAAVAAPAPAPAPAAPPPAPKAAPVPAPKAYLVFFDWDKADITSEANAIIQRAAENAKSGGVTRIELTGHADRSGTDKYNMGLSMRRANAVKEVLVRQGLAGASINVVGKGETTPLVPTPDEPQNRRVEIVLP